MIGFTRISWICTGNVLVPKWLLGEAEGCVRSTYSQGPKDPMGADPDGDRGLRHLAPTYLCRDTRDPRSDGHRGLASFRACPPRTWRCAAQLSIDAAGETARETDRRPSCVFYFSAIWSADQGAARSSRRCPDCASAIVSISWW